MDTPNSTPKSEEPPQACSMQRAGYAARYDHGEVRLRVPSYDEWSGHTHAQHVLELDAAARLSAELAQAVEEARRHTAAGEPRGNVTPANQ
jgi:hypothetical protein